MIVRPQPAGYPELGLAPRTPVPGKTPGQLARAVERREHRHGNPAFELRHLSRLPAPMGQELASVLVALRERFPAVRPDYVDVCVQMPNDVLGVTYTYGDLLPSMRQLAPSTPFSPEEAWAEGMGTRTELSRATGVRDVTATGCIEITADFSTVQRYARTAADVAANEVRRVMRGLSPQPALHVSLPTSVLVHEFGHLAEAALADLGFDAIEAVFSELSTAVLGVGTPDVRQWRYHLANYPALPGSLAGPHSGGPSRKKATRHALRHRLGETLGRYAAVNRDELFAEAFCLALVGPPELRGLLAPFLDETSAWLADQ